MLTKIKRIISLIESFIERVGNLVSWFIILLVLIIVYDIAMRYLFQIGSVALQELEWHFFSLIFLLGGAYTFKHNGHVRVDIIYQSRYMDNKKRAWVDILGGIFLLFPFCILIIISSFPFVANSFSLGEGSPDPGGLPFRYLLKAVIPSAFFLLMLQGLAHTLRNVCTLIELDSPKQSQTPAKEN